MLSRVANNLYWTGRYIERSEHFARYLNVQYFTSLDAPHQGQRDLALRSILDMVGIEEDEKKLLEEEVLVSVALDEDNPVSILSSVYYGRENARSVRQSLSTELWESINAYYWFVKNYPVDVYKTRGLWDFTQGIITNSAIVKGKVDGTIMRNLGWLFLKLGSYVEKTVQIARIIISKVSDIIELEKFKLGKSLKSRQWNILLDCLEAKDMYRSVYSTGINKTGCLEYLILNQYSPCSIVYNLQKIEQNIGKIYDTGHTNKQNAKSIKFKVGKIISKYKYLNINEIEDGVVVFLEEMLSEIYKINDIVEEEFFKK